MFEAILYDTLCGSVVIHFLVSPACPPVFMIFQEEFCPGDSVWIEGQWISDPGQYTFVQSHPMTLCDTVFDYFLTHPSPPVIESVLDWDCIELGSISLDLTGNGPFDIEWNPTGQDSTVLEGLADGQYTVVVMDVNGCMAADTFTVISSPPLVFSLPSEFFVADGDSIWISIAGDIGEPGLQFLWSPASIAGCPTCPSSWVYASQDTLIMILITDANQCTYALQTQILVQSDTSMRDELYIPNVFSPNDDGINDRWRMYTRMHNAYVHALTLFDRWGSMILHKEEFELESFVGWDGTFNGQPYNPGVFVYIAELTLGDGRRLRVKGDVTLIR